MDRNYSRIKFGDNVFRSPRAKYSDDTKKLIKVLMEEAKVTMLQRRTIHDALERGDPLPPAQQPPSHQKTLRAKKPALPAEWKKRTLDMIINSGAYERQQYRRTTPLPNSEAQKRRLAYLMAYGRDMPPTPRETPYYLRARKETPVDVDYDPIEDLVRGIEERMEFLKDMESLGEGKKYRPVIQQEIAQKIRLIEALDSEGSSGVRREIEKYKAERPVPKPFPLGELGG